MLHWKKIVCPVDFSASSREAAHLAADLAARLDAELTLLHIYELPTFAMADSLVLPSATELRESLDGFDEELARWKGDLGWRGGARIKTASEIGAGGVAQEIIQFARNGAYDVIVVGTHGRTGLSHALLGSVAERLVRRAEMPVITVRPQPAVAEERLVV
jgi:nucleotide-binding universal stress UspA family protein